MSQSAKPAHTLANFAVRNATGKGSKQTLDSNSGCIPADKLREICEKHYNQILPIMAEKVQHSESESYDRKKRPKKRRQSPVTASRGTRPSQTASIFSRLRRKRDKPTRRRSPVSATVFTRLGPRDKNVFKRLGERKRDIHSRLGPDNASRHGHANRKRSTSRSAKTPSQRNVSKKSKKNGTPPIAKAAGRIPGPKSCMNQKATMTWADTGSPKSK
ncbi:hypothetical protein Tco_1493499, partial [Tanacetum coccineum]